MDDRFHLDRFAAAQDGGDSYLHALAELRLGRKSTHWMWFVFPQIAGLGHSATSRRFAIASRAEAVAFLHHPVLGPRLVEYTRTVADSAATSAEDLFGFVDARKLHSSMTLFLRASDSSMAAGFRRVLDRYFDGRADGATDQRL